MGGFGSGRHAYYGVKATTSDYRFIDVRRWRRDGLLVPGHVFGWQWSRDRDVVASINVRVEDDSVILSYRHRSGVSAWKDENYSVGIVWTACHLGGRRPWFLCPARGCGRRVAILFGGAIFACRSCHDLAYQCQRETGYDRAARRADKIRERLGWGPGILNGRGLKPKGMRWSTFERLVAAHDAHLQRSLEEMRLHLGRLGSDMEWDF